MSAEQAINDKLQGSVPTYFSVVGLLITKLKKGLLLSLWVKCFNRWIFGNKNSYKQECDCFVHFLLLLAVRSPNAQSAQDNHVLDSPPFPLEVGLLNPATGA